METTKIHAERLVVGDEIVTDRDYQAGRSNLYGTDFVVIFGSTAAFMAGDERGPNDIDVVYGGSVSAADASSAASAYIESRAVQEVAAIEPLIDRAEISRLNSFADRAAARSNRCFGLFAALHNEDIAAGMDQLSPLTERARQRSIAARAEMESAQSAYRAAYAPAGRQHAIERLAAGQISIDCHRARARDDVVHLTTPKGAAGHAIVVGGDVRVEFAEVESLPGIIRVHHTAPERCVALCLEYLRRVGGRWGGIHREFRFLPYDGADHDAYTRDGITAVQNARRQCTAEEWAAIVAGLGDFGPVLEAMSTSSGLNAEFRARHHGASCEGGDGVLCLGWDTQTFYYPYGGAEDEGFSFETITKLLR